MTDTTRSLAAIRAAYAQITEESTEQEIEAAIASATVELRLVASDVAGFANALDDGTGFANSSTEFGEQLAKQFDETRRISTVVGVMQALGTHEALVAVEMALLRLNARTGPHALRRELLSDSDRAALERIRVLAAETLVDAQMPNDPEDEDV